VTILWGADDLMAQVNSKETRCSSIVPTTLTISSHTSCSISCTTGSVAESDGPFPASFPHGVVHHLRRVDHSQTADNPWIADGGECPEDDKEDEVAQGALAGGAGNMTKKQINDGYGGGLWRSDQKVGRVWLFPSQSSKLHPFRAFAG